MGEREREANKSVPVQEKAGKGVTMKKLYWQRCGHEQKMIQANKWPWKNDTSKEAAVKRWCWLQCGHENYTGQKKTQYKQICGYEKMTLAKGQVWKDDTGQGWAMKRNDKGQGVAIKRNYNGKRGKCQKMILAKVWSRRKKGYSPKCGYEKKDTG